MDFYGAGTDRHPPTLTPSEKRRFTRTYYSTWGLLRIDPALWDSRLQAATSQELYLIHEMTRLTSSIGREEKVPRPPHSDANLGIDLNWSHCRCDLERRVWQQIQTNSVQYFDLNAASIEFLSFELGALYFIALWDHWQEPLKEIILHHNRTTIKLNPAMIKDRLWNDDEDELYQATHDIGKT